MNVLPQLDRGAETPLQEQLAQQLRQHIISGTLKPNSRLIATRFLAEQIGISRTTVLLAYEQLISEGYLETRPAVGTFVSSVPPESPRKIASQNDMADTPRQAVLHPVQMRASSAPQKLCAEGDIDFRPAAHDIRLSMPPNVWAKEMRDAVARSADVFASAQSIAGLPILRKNISDYLALTRGFLAGPDQVIIVAGQRQACSLIAHLFQRVGDKVVVESPGCPDVIRFFKARGADLVHVPVDERGIETGKLPREPVSLAYVSPARQNPTGGIMPQTRRAALIKWARTAGAYLIEDDCGIEPHYQGIVTMPVAASDPFGLTFYVGSLAKVLGAGLNLNFIIAPPEFVDPILALKTAMDAGGSPLEQVIAADLLGSGDYDKHLRRFRKICLERRDVLIDSLRTHFGAVRLMGTEGGTYLTWHLPDELCSARAVCEVALMHGVHVEGVICESPSPSYLHDRALILGYAALEPNQLQQGVALLAKAVTA